MQENIEQLKIQQFNTYKSAIIETIKNNTNVLTNEDLMSLLKKPPLDSMDSIKSRFLGLAKKNKIILNTESLSMILDSYREDLVKCVPKITKRRNDYLLSIVQKYNDSGSIIKLLKKDFNVLNKDIRKIFKDNLDKSNTSLIEKFDTVFSNDIEDNIKEKIVNDVSKFVKGSYERQLLENVDIKILVKDTTLINLVKEQTERHLFTLENSHLFKDNI
ncbi:MAG: hypothetical protein IKH54_04795 [Bacilli bacterium]|nr:hypothetical protein [Bacilli bacterium]